MTNLKPVWIDTDCGVDDAFALLTAFKLPSIDVVGISAVCGNVECDKTFRNARNIASLASREDIKVYKGADSPLAVPLKPAYNVHGEDGLGGVAIPESKAPVETKNAFDALYEKAKELNGELIVVAVGPLTNIATTIYAHPDFTDYVKEIDIMGGSVAFGGNCTVAAEFNIYADPHAAQTVFKCGVPINMFGLDVTMKAMLTRDDINLIKELKGPVAEFAGKACEIPMGLYKMLGLGDFMCLHDSCPVMYLEKPEMFTGKKAGVYVETQSELSLGRTVSDIFVHADELFKEKNTTVMLDIDRDMMVNLVLETFKAY